MAPTKADAYSRLAQEVEGSFNHRFWYFAGGYLYDVVDMESGQDDAFRPNQILALGLPFPALEKRAGDRCWMPSPTAC